MKAIPLLVTLTDFEYCFNRILFYFTEHLIKDMYLPEYNYPLWGYLRFYNDILRGNAQVPIIYCLLPLLLKIDTATFDVNMTNYFQDIIKNQFQRLLTVPPYKLTLFCNTYMEEKYFALFLPSSFYYEFYSKNEKINHLDLTDNYSSAIL